LQGILTKKGRAIAALPSEWLISQIVKRLQNARYIAGIHTFEKKSR